MIHSIPRASGALLIGLVIFAAGCGERGTTGGTADADKQAVGTTLGTSAPHQLVRQGAELFAKRCAPCHGSDGNGRGSRSGPSLQRTNFTYGRTPETIAQSIREGRPGGMPAFGHAFQQSQIDALTAYILTLAR